MRYVLTGAAALALAATGAWADPGGGHGGGNGGGGGNGHGPAAAMPGGGGHGNGGGGNGGGKAKHEAMNGNGGGQQAKHGGNPGGATRADKGNADKGNKADKAMARSMGHADKGDVVRANRNDRFDVRDGRDRYATAGDARQVRRDVNVVRLGDGGRYGVIDGCPPGLAKKNNGCTPPGLLKGSDDWRQASYRPNWFGYDNAASGNYYYDDGYLYRLGANNSVLGYLPLLGGALSVGNPWPTNYQQANVPQYYVDYYNLGPSNSYRYADNVLYRVDPQSSSISSIAALLTGDPFAVGQQMPSGYDVYNVPYAYQDRYVDGPDADYRYSDGYVYQVDPTTQLIQAAIQLLT
jgi:hypothetical protein